MGICVFSVRHKISSKQYRYGVVTSNRLGCWWIATYNVAQMLNLNLNPAAASEQNAEYSSMRNPEDIIKMYESTGLLLYGIYGNHPFAVADFFAKRNCDVKVVLSDFDNSDNLSSTNIIFMDSSSIGHFVAVKYDGEDFYGYNTFCNNSTYDYLGKQISVVNEVIDKGKDTEKTVSHNTKILISITPKEQTTIA